MRLSELTEKVYSLTYPELTPEQKKEAEKLASMYPHKVYAQGITISGNLKPTKKRISATFPRIKPEEVFIKIDDIKIPKQLIRDKLNTCNCSIPGKDIAGTGQCGYCHKTVANPLDVSMDIDARTTNHVKDKEE